MANISTTNGSLYFSKNFYNRHKKLLNNWINNYNFSDFNYGFTSFEVEEDTNDWNDYFIVNFTGSGRWTWANTINSLITNDSTSSYFNKYQAKLIETLYKENETITMEYTDYESGCELFLDSHGCLNIVKNNQGYLELEYTLVYDESRDFTDYNRIIYDYEEGFLLTLTEDVEQLNEIITNLYNEYNLSSKGDLYQFKKRAMNYILKDEELAGGICMYRLEDEEYFITAVYEFKG